MATHIKKNPICLSIGIMACNEEGSIRATLESLFRQSVFDRLWSRYEGCEVVLVANACTDRTAAVAQEVFDQVARKHEWADAITTRVIELPEAGKCNAWNRFVHEFSSLEARFLCLLEADIVFHQRNTLVSLVSALECRPYANAASGRPCSTVLFKPRKNLRDRIALATAEMTVGGQGRLCAQLYCVRAPVARRILLPRSLASEAGLVRELVCTDLLTRRSDPARITFVRGAVHVVEARAMPGAELATRREELIREATLHALTSFLKSRSLAQRRALAETVRQLERCDAEWLNKLVEQHLRGRRFWQLFPGLPTLELRRLWFQPGLQKLTHLPAAVMGMWVMAVASWHAHRFLRRGIIASSAKAAGPAAMSLSPSGHHPL